MEIHHLYVVYHIYSINKYCNYHYSYPIQNAINIFYKINIELNFTHHVNFVNKDYNLYQTKYVLI